MEEFIKRYDKFKDNNLPTPFWDEERQTLEYVYFNNNELDVNYSLTESLGKIICTNFYYSYTSKNIYESIVDGKRITKEVIGHSHAHTFEDVVKALYNYPEVFSISKEEEQFYSKQELDYLRRLQKYLLFINMKDLSDNSRYQNKLQSKYNNVCVYRFNDEIINNMINGSINFKANKYYKDSESKFNHYKALIMDNDNNYRLYVEFTNSEIKQYKDIKNIYTINNLNDNDKVVVTYFNILEIF